MKKLLSVALAVLMAVSCMSFAAFAEEVAPVTVTLNGEVVDCAAYGQPATIVEGRTLVPLRAIFEALGATVEWDQVTKTVTSELDGTKIELTIGSDTFYKNDEPIDLDVPGMIMNGRTLVPARAVAEAYGVDVQWDAATRTVILTKEEKPAIPVIEGAVISSLTGENLDQYEKSMLWGENNVGLKAVENPEKEGDMVIALETNVQDKQAWNYLWYNANNEPNKYVPGERYVITFSVLPGNDAFGNPVINGSIGINVRVDGKDKGVDSIVLQESGWKNCAYIYTIPAETDPSKDMKFGIFASPVTVAGYDHPLAWSIYLDNISVVPYKGDLEDGRTDATYFMGATGAGVPSGFDFDSAAGETVELSVLSSTTGSYNSEKKAFVFEAAGEMTDPLVMINDLAVDASKVPAVAVKFKKLSVDNATSMQVFFTTEADGNVSEDKSLTVYYSSCAEDADGNLIAYFDFANEEKTANLWNGTVNKLRLDPGNGNGVWEVYGIKLIEA